MLALEKARRLANDGFQTLLSCDNRQLADHLARLCAGTANLDVMSFHQLCHRRVERANRESGRDLLAEAKITYPGKDLYDVQFPNALTYSLEILPTGYEAIICDEGHDNAMAESFFATLECELLERTRFHDHRQAQRAIFEFIEGWYKDRACERNGLLT